MWTPRVLTLATLYQLAVVLVTTAVTYALWPAGGLAVLVGGAFATLNFWGLRQLVMRTVQATSPRHKLVYGLFLAVKTVLALAVMAALLLLLRLHPLAFALGLSTLFLGIGLAVSHVLFTHKAPTA